MILATSIGVAFCGVALVALHYFPWPKRLTRPQAYIVGTLAIIATFSGVCIYLAWWLPLAAIWAITVGAGIAVLMCYAYDAWRGATNLLRMGKHGDSSDDA